MQEDQGLPDVETQEQRSVVPDGFRIRRSQAQHIEYRSKAKVARAVDS